MRPGLKTIRTADLFCGAGGSSTGLLRAAARLGRTVDLLAVNHWKEAIDTHELNHPGVRHLHEDLAAIDPRQAVPGGTLDLLWASPECTSHSYSRGDKPISEQSRASAWHPFRWCDQLNVKAFIIENVPSFRAWGPTDRRGRAIQARKGETYRQHLDMLRALGYTVDARVLNAADYGAATTRRRLFIIGLKGTRKIRWPEPTHAPAGMLLPGRQPWRGAKEIIDPALHGRSIFNRPKPLARKTLERILMGGERYWPTLRPYLTILRQHMATAPMEAPLPTIAAGGTHIGYVEPVLVQVSHGDSRGRVRSAAAPMGTLSGSRELGVAEAFLLQQQSGGVARPVTEPAPTVATKGAISLVEPILTDGEHEAPAGTPFLIPFFGERATQAPRTHSIDEPLPTITGHGAGGVAKPFLMKYSRTGGARSTEQPLDTLTAKPRYGVVTPHGIRVGDNLYLDIRFRMLRVHELAAGMGFPAGYQFTGSIDERVKQVGNAVEVHQAEALCWAVLA